MIPVRRRPRDDAVRKDQEIVFAVTAAGLAPARAGRSLVLSTEAAASSVQVGSTELSPRKRVEGYQRPMERTLWAR